MFCSKCGCKLPNEATACKNCGAPANLAEYCGGFWNLVGEKPPVPAAPISEEKVPAPAPVAEEKKPTPAPVAPINTPTEKAKRKKPIFWYILSALLLLLLLVQTIRVAHFSSQLEKSQAAYTGIKAELDDVHETLDALSEAVVSLATPANDAEEHLPEEPSPDDVDIQAIYNSIEEIRELLMSGEFGVVENTTVVLPPLPDGGGEPVVLPPEPPVEEPPVESAPEKD